jgi:hypothetical protein
VFLVWSDASALHATSKAVRYHSVGKWSPRFTIAAERAVLTAIAGGDSRWQWMRKWIFDDGCSEHRAAAGQLENLGGALSHVQQPIRLHLA